MYAPLPVWTLGQSIEPPLEIELARESERPGGIGLAGTWQPGRHHTPVGAGKRKFMCGRCWQVRGCAMANRHGWHDFVTLISGGLLSGGEVERPLDEAPYQRRRREYQHVNRRAPKREAVLAGILRGERYTQIARRTGMTYRAVSCQACLLFKKHDVHSREELIAKMQMAAASSLAG